MLFIYLFKFFKVFFLYKFFNKFYLMIIINFFINLKKDDLCFKYVCYMIFIKLGILSDID